MKQNSGGYSMIKILAIGNSFSEDATAYLYDIAKADGVELKVVNLYIGGCSLERHWSNITADEAAYDYQLNGQYTERKISIREALLEEQWDYVVTQQVSNYSGILDTYYPYITLVLDYVKQLAPGAKQLLHQTWAYEIDSDHSAFVNYHSNQNEMYLALTDAYNNVAKDLSLPLIPCGKVIQTLRAMPFFDYAKGGLSLCRDGYHMNLVYGRYALAATWYEFILKKNILDNNYLPPVMDGLTAEEVVMKLVKETIHKIVSDRIR
jgi:hypothetical protein